MKNRIAKHAAAVMISGLLAGTASTYVNASFDSNPPVEEPVEISREAGQQEGQLPPQAPGQFVKTQENGQPAVPPERIGCYEQNEMPEGTMLAVDTEMNQFMPPMMPGREDMRMPMGDAGSLQTVIDGVEDADLKAELQTLLDVVKAAETAEKTAMESGVDATEEEMEASRLTVMEAREALFAALAEAGLEPTGFMKEPAPAEDMSMTEAQPADQNMTMPAAAPEIPAGENEAAMSILDRIMHFLQGIRQ